MKNLFDCNGRFGNPSMSAPEFPAVKDVLNFMDYLGIQRSLVWNVESRDSNALWCNCRLIDQIRQTPGAKDRIIPSFYISPGMMYERGGIEGLTRLLADTKVAALRFHRGLSGYTLDQVQPIIREIVPFKPVLFLNHAEAEPSDILSFTEKYPQVPLVLMEFAWGHYTRVFNLMRQRPNILADISWCHVWGSVEMMIKHFGVERLLFGTGGKVHNGASIAALAQAQITESQRELIAHGNLERLLGLPPVSKLEKTADDTKTYWSKLIQGRPLGVDVIDAHVHLGPSGGYILEEQSFSGQIDQALAKMEQLGIANMIASSMTALASDPVEGNNQLEEHLTPLGGKILGYVAFNPYYDKGLISRLDQWFSGNVFVGFKLLCDYWRVPVTDPRFNAVWDYADRHCLPILIHTWNGGYNSPGMLKDIVKKYPNAIFLLAHSGGGDDGRREAEDLAVHNPNVYLEWCGSFCSSIPWEETLSRVGNNQVVFGTDAVYHDITWELGRLLSVKVHQETIAPILGANMRKILARRQ